MKKSIATPRGQRRQAWPSSTKGCTKGPVAAEDVVESDHWFTDLDLPYVRHHRSQQRLHLELRQVPSRTAVDTVAKAHVVAGIAGDVETIRVGIAAFIPVG